MNNLKLLVANKKDSDQLLLIEKNLGRVPKQIIDWYNSSKEDNTYLYQLNQMIFFTEDDIINGIGYVNGYLDSKFCNLSVETLEEDKNIKKEVIEKSTNYVFNELNMDTVNITIKTNDTDITNFMINSNYELIDKTLDTSTFIKDNPKGL